MGIVLPHKVYILAKKTYTLYFVRAKVPKGYKTKIWTLRKDDAHGLALLIGIVHYRPSWRQYVFMAEPKTDMASGCEKFVAAFLDYQNIERCKI